MKKLLFIFLIIMKLTLLGQSCSSLFSFAGYLEKVTFYNQSSLSNAHYYWNFGDGTSSNLKNPVHIYPENGNYLVTLYVLDTVSKCSSFYDQWINIVKFSTEPCNPSISDSIFTNGGADFIKIIQHSTNCNFIYPPNYSCGFFSGFQNTIYDLPTPSANLIFRSVYADADSIGGLAYFKRAAFITVPYKYNRSKNYGGCSANFEFKVVSENILGQKILFTAMNKSANSYDWTFIGFGNPEHYFSDTVSHFFPFTYTSTPVLNPIWAIGLAISEQNGCVDTLYQHINIFNTSNTFVGVKENMSELNFNLYPNPTNSMINISDDKNQLQNSYIEIKNYLGQTVYSNSFTNQINLSNLSNGMYFLTIRDKFAAKTIKIIKQ